MRLLLITFAVFAFVLSFGQVSTPKQGSKIRTAIMDAIRVPTERDLKQKVVFKVDLLRVEGVWAFTRTVPQQPNGKPIDFSKTQYAEASAHGAFGNGVIALLKKKGDKWTVVKYSLGATDVPYVSWWKDFGAPKAIFDYTG